MGCKHKFHLEQPCRKEISHAITDLLAPNKHVRQIIVSVSKAEIKMESLKRLNDLSIIIQEVSVKRRKRLKPVTSQEKPYAVDHNPSLVKD